MRIYGHERQYLTLPVLVAGLTSRSWAPRPALMAQLTGAQPGHSAEHCTQHSDPGSPHADLLDTLEPVAGHLRPKDCHALRSACRALRFHPALLGSVTSVNIESTADRRAIDFTFPGRLPNLQELWFAGPASLRHLRRFSSLQRLTKLSLSDYKDALELLPLQQLSSLRSLRLWSIPEHYNLDGLTQLHKLDLVGTCGTTALLGLRSSLKCLKAYDGADAPHFSRLMSLTRLQYGPGDRGPWGDLWGDDVVAATFTGLQHLVSLRVLTIRLDEGWGVPAVVGGLSSLTRLSALSLDSCQEEIVGSVLDLSSLSRLARLGLTFFEGPLCVRAPSVSSLYLHTCETHQYQELPDLTACSRLVHLQLWLCGGSGSLVVAADRLPPQWTTVSVQTWVQKVGGHGSPREVAAGQRDVLPEGAQTAVSGERNA